MHYWLLGWLAGWLNDDDADDEEEVGCQFIGRRYTTHSRDSLQWWIAFLCLLLRAAGGDEFLHLTLISLELMNVSCENVAD